MTDMPEEIWHRIKLEDIAEATGTKPRCLTGEVTAATRLVLDLDNGKHLVLQVGDTPDHYCVEMLPGRYDYESEDEWLFQERRRKHNHD